MTNLIVHEDIAQKLQRISQQEKRSVDEILRSFVDKYDAESGTTTDEKSDNKPQPAHWGREVLALLDGHEPINWEPPDIDDPVEWVKEQRRQQARHRGIPWGDE